MPRPERLPPLLTLLAASCAAPQPAAPAAPAPTIAAPPITRVAPGWRRGDERRSSNSAGELLQALGILSIIERQAGVAVIARIPESVSVTTDQNSFTSAGVPPRSGVPDRHRRIYRSGDHPREAAERWTNACRRAG